MNPHLPLVESVCALARGRFSGWDHQLLRWEGNRSLQLHTGLVRDLFDFRAYCVDILGVRAGQSNSSFGDHSKIPSSFCFLAEFTARPCTVKNIGILRAKIIRSARILVDEITATLFLNKRTKSVYGKIMGW